MVDIIIPAYNAHKTIERTLFSILYQENLDKINTYIINDGSTKGYSDLVKFFSNFMTIKEITLDENKGPAVARQCGINCSKSEYIIFIDSDDVFYNSYAVKKLLDEISTKNYDIVVSNFIEETTDGFIEHNNDTIWLHGKIYKRKFLNENKIAFNDSRANEDNGFNQLLFLHEPRAIFIDEKTYIWCKNNMSITRKNNYEYRLQGLEGYVYNINWAIETASSHSCNYTKIARLAYRSLIAMYCYFLEFKYLKLIKLSKILKEKSELYPLDDNQKLEIMENQLQFMYNNNTRRYLLNASITFNTFLEEIDKI